MEADHTFDDVVRRENTLQGEKDGRDEAAAAKKQAFEKMLLDQPKETQGRQK